MNARPIIENFFICSCSLYSTRRRMAENKILSTYNWQDIGYYNLAKA